VLDSALDGGEREEEAMLGFFAIQIWLEAFRYGAGEVGLMNSESLLRSRKKEASGVGHQSDCSREPVLH